ncbi:hypothetical protein [Ulvibacterium sp.]|uniref:hypothetical protein n=1 Tax=Ulvibacterium sp. TaxID=2665914 RepID=UPI00260452F5|nr:hypothetical protein [Ulvibacterium sp.]
MKTVKLAILGLVLLVSYQCKEAKKESEENAKEAMADSSEKFNLVKDSTKVGFTAYKTTEKLPVGGKFLKIDITESEPGSTAMDAMNGTAFSIPISSLFTNDGTGTRDPKIIEFFFGAMKNTSLISGVFKVSEDGKPSIDVTLNGATENIPLESEKTSENAYTFSGVMNLENWDALDAVASINKACEALHTGKDGISKTWSEVAVQAQVLLEKIE